MSCSHQSGRLLSLTATLSRAGSVESAVTTAIETAEAVFSNPVVSVCERNSADRSAIAVGSTTLGSGQIEPVPDEIPEEVDQQCRERASKRQVADTPDAVIDPDPRGELRLEAFVPAGRDRVFCLGVTHQDGLDTADVSVLEGIAANLEAALSRLDHDAPATPESDAAALRQLNELTIRAGEFDTTLERVLALGCDHLAVGTAIFSRIDGGDYYIEATVDETGTYETGSVHDLEEMICHVAIDGEVTEPLAFADIADTEYRDHPGAEAVSACLATPVIVDGDIYGTINFSSTGTRSKPFRSADEEFVKHIAQWVGSEIERRQRFAELERYETILETVEDTVYALDTDGQFTYANEAAKGEFGYGPEPAETSLPFEAPDHLEQIRDQITELTATDTRSTTAEFEFESGDGSQTIVENRLTLIGEDGSDGMAGVLRDITARKTRTQRLESFQRAIENTADGIAILDNQEFSYVDQTHIDMYGFDTKEELLGNTWRKLYDEEEIEHLETAAFPVLESEGQWRGVVTGSRPDGSTFPAELSLTLIGDRQLICTVRDITERKAKQRERRHTERRYRLLAENIPDGAVFTFDDSLEYQLAAGELISKFGYSETDLLGEKVGSVAGSDGPEVLPWYEAALEGERTDSQIELYDRTLRVQIVPVDNPEGDSANIHGMALVQDITDDARRRRELYEERERFRLLIESVDEYAFLVINPDGTVQTWNPSAESMYGHDTETAIGMPMAHLYPETDREQGLSDRLLQQAHITGDSAYEGWQIRADGSRFYADIHHAPIETDDGEFRGYAKIVRDLSDRRRQQRRTERFVENSEDVVTIVETDGTIAYASGSAERVLGYESDSLTGENLFDYLHPDGRKRTMQTFFDATDDPSADRRIECRFRSGDGGWLNVTGQCQNMRDDDAIDGMLLYLRDVTEIKQQTRRFESIFDQTFQFAALLEPDGTVIKMNDAAIEFGGFDQAEFEIVGTQFCDTSPWCHSEAVHTAVQDAIERAANGEFVRYETKVRAGDGLASLDFSVRPVTDEDGKVVSLVAEARDITAQKQHRQHLEVMQRVMRHKVRNDLTKLRGWTRMISEEDDPQRRIERFHTVDSILADWEKLTNKMKQTRNILGSSKANQTTAAPESLVRESVASLEDDFSEATIVADLSDPGETRVPITISRAIRELVENAVAASTDPTIEVSLECSDSGWITVGVKDDGPGMPETEATVLETGEETPLNHGQGFGLWMVRMIVTHAGGDIAVELTPDGTQVWLRLPARRDLQPETTVEPAK